jgi:integrase
LGAIKIVKAKGHPRLYRRGAIYYHRAAIPKDIAATYPKKEETFSLRTTDRLEALRLVRVAASSVDRKFDAHRQTLLSQSKPLESLSDSQIEDLSECYYRALLEGDDDVRSDGFMPVTEFDARYDVNWPPTSQEWERHNFDERLESIRESGESAAYYYARGIVDPFYMEEARDILSWDGIGLSLDEHSPSWRELVRALQKAAIKASEALQRRTNGELIETPKGTPTPSLRLVSRSEEASYPGSHSPKASTIIDEWVREKSREWAEKTQSDHRAVLRYFITIAGDKPLHQYTKADGRSFKSVLMRLPANWTKKPDLRDLDVETAAQKAESLGLPPMSTTNVNKYLRFVSSFWIWAIDNYESGLKNPMTGLRVKTSRAAREERDPFSSSELERVFSSPVYAGCHSSYKWLSPGDVILKNSAMYWVPLLALFTGARMGELLQLYVDDVKLEGDIPFLDINEDGPDKKLKTRSSARKIPVHSELVRIGFLSHVEEVKAKGHKRVFLDIEKGSDGYYSSIFSKRFARLLTTLGIKHGQNAFHSFRHNFEDACRNSGLPSELMNALQGHAEQGMAGRYGRGFALEKLAQGIAKLSYPGLNLNSLYINQQEVIKCPKPSRSKAELSNF